MTTVVGTIVNRPGEVDAASPGSALVPARRGGAPGAPTAMARRAEFDGMPVAVMTRTAGGGARFGIPGAALPPGSVSEVAIPTSREVRSYAASRGASPVVVMPMPMRVGATLERIDEARREAREEEYTRRHEDLADRQEQMVDAQAKMLDAEMQMEILRAETRMVGMLREITTEGFRNLADAAK